MSGANVLVVDDADDFRATVRRSLEREGHGVQEAADGAEAPRRLQAETYNLAIVDLSMPGVNGLELLESLRAARRQIPPTIMVTAFGDWGAYARALELGVVAFVIKPVGMAELLGEVARGLADARPRRDGDGSRELQ